MTRIADIKHIYKILVEKPLGEWLLKEARRIWEDEIKMCLES
jgi:hypothetical protein